MSQPPRQVALLGGSFDPVHRGHMALAQAALEQLPIDELWWVPVGQAWQKSRPLTAAHHRVAMLELAIGREPRQRIEPCEIKREGPTYTIDTLNTLSQAHPGLVWHLLLGWDQFLNLPTWKQWDDVVSRVKLVVVGRPGASVQERPAALRHLSIELLHMAPLDISSTGIRSDVARSRSVLDRVSAPVARYIADHGLYGGLEPG